MSLRAAHGNGAGAVVRVETMPADELPEPVAAPLTACSRGLGHAAVGQFRDRELAREAGRRGGMAKARRVRLVDALGLRKIADESTFKPYLDAAEEFTSHHRAELARQAGGQLGAAPSSMIASAALQLAASRWCFDKGAETGEVGWMTSGSRFANDSRQNLLAAYELAVREAKARAAGPLASAPWLEAAEPSPSETSSSDTSPQVEDATQSGPESSGT